MDLAFPSRRWTAAFLLSCLTILLAATGLSAQSAASSGRSKALIVNAVREADRTPLRGSVEALAKGMIDDGAAPSSLRLEKMILVLKRPADKQAALDRLLAEQQNANSANYHRWLSPSDFGRRFGAEQADIDAVTSWLSSHGFTVDAVAENRGMIVFSGDNAQLQAAFQTSIRKVRDAVTGASHYASLSTPTIPSALAPAVSGFARLSNIPFKPMHVDYGLARLHKSDRSWTLDSSNTKTADSKIKPQLNVDFGAIYHAVSPYDFATIYNVKPLWDAGVDGAGQSIAVVAKSDIDLKDVASFRKSFNLPEGDIEVLYAGPQPGFTQSEGEAVLDAEWSGAIAPKAKIYVVTSDDTVTSDGLFLDFYYAIDKNLSPVLSVSWGACELGLSSTGHQYVSDLWEQASAQGVTVLISSGDAGAAACDQNYKYATHGLAVNGLASTHYDTAVGGTDLYGSYTNPSRYWSPSNDPTTLQSALSYVQEAPWNDSCANPLVLKAFQDHGASDATMEALCNDSNLASRVLSTAGGGGGRSNCTSHNGSDASSCSGGWAKPSWQSGVAGIPADGVRDMPDISFFSGGGRWGSFYVYCLSSASPNGTCDFTNPDDVNYMAAGGTSFAAPAFAGAVALLNQKTSARQGLINPVLYKLAAKQYSTAEGLSQCDGSAGSDEASCIFHDVTIAGISEPCAQGSPDCVINDPSNNYYGVLSGYDAGAGFDLATGLGSANLANLVNHWSDAASIFLASATTLAPDQTSFVYGQNDGGSISVAAAGVTGQPSGDVSILADGFGAGPFTLSDGKASFSLLGLAAGVHKIKAHYAGDATFAFSDSPELAITVAKAATKLTAVASRTVLNYGDSLTLTAVVSTASLADEPSGVLVFTNKTTGQILGSAAVKAVDGVSTAQVQASLTVQGSQLISGDNQIVASYAGDNNYAAPDAYALTVSYHGPFTLTAASGSFNVAANGSGSLALSLVSNAGGFKKDVTLSCPSNLPAGLSCVFSPAVIPAGSTTANVTLSVYASSSQLSASALAQRRSSSPWSSLLVVGVCLGAGCCLRRRRVLLMMLAACALFALASGCGSNGGLRASQTSIAVSSPSVALGQPVSLTAKVAAFRGGGMPSGTVAFYDGSLLIGSGALSNGVATASIPHFAVGDHPMTAVYSGDSSFDASSSTVAHADVTYTYNLTVTAKDGNGDASAVTVPVTVQ